MKEKLRFLGMDVHAETIAAAIAEPDGEVRSLGTIPNRMESVRKLIKKLGPAEKLRVCYEAEATGYVLYWQLAELGVQCEVIAPSLDRGLGGGRENRRSGALSSQASGCYAGGENEPSQPLHHDLHQGGADAGRLHFPDSAGKRPNAESY
jgi:hypothetical protein